jgi:hypothetical protein
MWAALPFLWLFLQGYGYVVLLSLAPRLGRGRRRAPPVPAAG